MNDSITKPCVICGELSRESRCEEHQRDLQRDRNARAGRRTNLSRWSRLSRRLRAIQPWCDWCGTIDRLQVDHILPVNDRPDLEFTVENLRVLCASCNGRRGTEVTDDERQLVEARLADRRARLLRRATQGGDPAPGPSTHAPVGEDPNGISDIS